MKGVLLPSNIPSRSKRTRKRGELAQSMVEFALTAPFLIILMLGVIDFGRVYFAYISVTNSARTGADVAAANCDPSCDADDLTAIREAVGLETTQLLNTSPTNPDVSVSTGESLGSDFVDVTVSYTFTTLFPWPGLSDSMNVERTVSARVQE
jgi:Flp pilus assembly protein TadG